MSSWNCRYEVNGICKKVDGAYCRPGMKGCILVGKVTFQDGVIPTPLWPSEEGGPFPDRSGDRDPTQ
jgi:hypothetical protein